MVRGDTMKLGAEGDDVLALQHALSRYGYGIETDGRYSAATMEVVTAFQRHFRPERVDGLVDHSTLTTLQALLATLPGETTVAAT
jgi:N-acetylmuramoyl-L-alanine amidase